MRTNGENAVQTRTTLEALAARCEKAEGGDRELDAAIDRLFNERPKNGDYDEGEQAFWRISEPWCGLLERPNGFARGSFCAARYTASLDAAMTLVPTPGKWSITSGHGDDQWEAWVWLKDGTPPNWRIASAPALALVAASLRARAALEEG